MPRAGRNILDIYKELERKHDCFTITRGCLYCLSCSKQMTSNKEFISARIKEHLKSKAHQENDKEPVDGGRVQFPLEKIIDIGREAQAKQEQFLLDLTSAFVGSNIPFYRLELPILRDFFSKYTEFKIPSSNTLRYNHVEKIFEATLRKIRSVVGDNDIFMSIDETTDRCDRSQVNFICGVLNGEPHEPMLIHVAYAERCNSDTLHRLFIDACRAIWPTGEVHYGRVKLLVTDQAANMIRAGQLMKSLSPDLFHISCLAHCFSRVAEVVRECHPKLDKFLGKFKEVLRSGARKLKYKTHTKLSLPPKPIAIRWTTWLQAAEYAAKHLQKISSFVKSLKSTAKSVRTCQKLVESRELASELVSVSDFYFLIDATIKIQEKSMRLEEAAAILLDVGEKLDRPTLSRPREKFEASLAKNPHIRTILESRDVGLRIKMKYAPVVSADVERSFSKTKRVLTPERCSFEPENLVRHYIIAFNSHLMK